MDYSSIIFSIIYVLCGIGFVYIGAIMTYDMDNEGSRRLGQAVFAMAIRAFALSFLHAWRDPEVAMLCLLVADLSKAWIPTMTLLSLRFLIKDDSFLSKPTSMYNAIAFTLIHNILHLIVYAKNYTTLYLKNFKWAVHFENTFSYNVYNFSHIYLAFFLIAIIYVVYRDREYIQKTFSKKKSTFLIKYFLYIMPILLLTLVFKHMNFTDRDVSSIDVVLTIIPTYFMFTLISKKNIDKMLSRSQVLDVLDDLKEGIITINYEGYITYVNTGFMESLGMGDILGKKISDILPIDIEHEKAGSSLELLFDNKFLLCYYGNIEGNIKANEGKVLLLQDMTNLKMSQLELQELNKSLEDRVSLATKNLEESNLKLIEQITETKRLASEMERIANIDELTGLYNRRMMNGLIDEEISNYPDKKFALLYMDLNSFKYINDSMGHQIGDEILKVFSKKMLDFFIDFAYIGRIGGDEFIVFIRNNEDATQISKYCQGFISTLQENVNVFNHTLSIRTSIGISILNDDAHSKEELFNHSDKAMYFSKREGNNLYKFYNDIKGEI